MQKLKETQEKLFEEVKVLAQKISVFTTEEDFVNYINLINELQEKAVSLKNFKQINEIISEESIISQNIERQPINFEIDTKKIDDASTVIDANEDNSADLENQLEEEVSVEENVVSEKIDEEYFIENEEQQNDLSENIEKEKDISSSLNVEISENTSAKEEIEKKNEEEMLHEERRKIVAIEKSSHEHHEKLHEQKEEIHEERKEHQEKKFKLSNIKGLKSTVQSLFDEDPLEKILEKVKTPERETLAAERIKEEKPAPSLLKTNVPTDYMEAEKTLPDFKLDINDKLAFTKMLFDGSQLELNHVVNKLNSYKSLDEAKAYLSEVYYQRKWENADEYAQRLWSLVENKFL